MSSGESFAVLDASVNAVVGKFGSRSFPGVLLQGDTLRIIFDDIVELADELRTGNSDEAAEIAGGLQERIFDLLCHYETVLENNKIELPYPKSVQEDN